MGASRAASRRSWPWPPPTVGLVIWGTPLSSTAATAVTVRGRFNVGCLAQRLARLLISLPRELLEDDSSSIIETDRFYLQHPSAYFWSAMKVEGEPHCRRCGFRVSTVPVCLCVPCFRLLRALLERSKPRDFGNLSYWELDQVSADAVAAASAGRSDADDVSTTTDEWFLTWHELERPLRETFSLLHRHQLVLLPGNGRSNLAECIALTGIFRHVLATDAAHGVCEAMTSKNATVDSFLSTTSTRHSALTYQFDDVRKSTLESASVDCIVDKGVLDALACSLEVTSSNSCANKPREEHRAVGEYHRVLARRGILVLVTGRPRSVALSPFQRGGAWAMLNEIQFRRTSAHSNSKLKAEMAPSRDIPEQQCSIFVLSRK